MANNNRTVNDGTVDDFVGQPTYKRQRFLLGFVCQLKEGVSSTDLQKLVFLHTMESDSEFYAFVPYKFGPYSFQLQEDLEILYRDGFISVTKTGRSTHIKAVGNYRKEILLNIAPERGRALVLRAYREYPYYTVNSEIINELFVGEELDRFNEKRRSYSLSTYELFTIGYQGKTIEGFVNTLIKNDVKLLCDVRKNPLSRKFRFSKRPLEVTLNSVGIRYVHIPELGIESDKRAFLETDDDYLKLFDDYRAFHLRDVTLFEKIYELWAEHKRIALMCFESSSNMCHRHVISDYNVKTHKLKTIDL